jgi:hypothetical protein
VRRDAFWKVIGVSEYPVPQGRGHIRFRDFVLTNASSMETLTATAIPVNFFWASGLGLPTGPIAATLNFTASSTTTATTDAAGDIAEGGWSGNFSFVSATSGAVLLGATFGPTGSLTGSGGSASFADSTGANAPSEVTYTSSVSSLTQMLSTTTMRDFSFSLTNFSVAGDGTQNLAVDGNSRPVSGTYAASGTFAATPGPTTGIPEPATFALIGLALLSCGMIRRRRA